MKLQISVAERQPDVLRCQYLIAESYNRDFGIMFSEDIYDLDARIEPYSNRYIMGKVGNEVVTAMGLYTHNTYVERYGDVSSADVRERLEEAGVEDLSAATRIRETTKLVVRRGWGGLGLSFLIRYASYTHRFLSDGLEGSFVAVVCARRSLLDEFFYPGKSPIRARPLKPFPFYAVHAKYRTAEDPMESRLIIPELDIPEEIYRMSLPFEREIPDRPAGAAR